MPAAETNSGHMELQEFFLMFLTDCVQGGCSKRKPDINSPFKQGKALERLAGLCCAVGEILQLWQNLAQGRLLRKCLLNEELNHGHVLASLRAKSMAQLSL